MCGGDTTKSKVADKCTNTQLRKPISHFNFMKSWAETKALQVSSSSDNHTKHFLCNHLQAIIHLLAPSLSIVHFGEERVWIQSQPSAHLSFWLVAITTSPWKSACIDFLDSIYVMMSADMEVTNLCFFADGSWQMMEEWRLSHCRVTHRK